MNIIPHNIDFEGMTEYINEVTLAGADAIILSDPGVFSLVKETNPEMDIHISTQANNTNFHSAQFWISQGVKRIVLARELSLEEIKEIYNLTKGTVELEVFVHGSMCISYSGRCLLSSYMSGRDSNRGSCSHPCRWKYGLVEEQRPGEVYPVYENERGTYVFNSKDLCLLENVPSLIEAGISSMKIEGRMKSSFYVASVVGAYRKAIDLYYKCGSIAVANSSASLFEEMSKASHRQYTNGFLLSKTDSDDQVYEDNSYVVDYSYAGMILDYDTENKLYKIRQMNKYSLGEEIEIMLHSGDTITTTITEMQDENGNAIASAPHARMISYVGFDSAFQQSNQSIDPLTIMRKKL
jgi:putative protease